jgi:benzoate 4-monooxygenase
VRAFEPHIQAHIRELAGQWDRLCAAGARGEHGADADGWVGREGRVWLDCLPWLNFLAFDIIGRLAFGRPFGMLAVARDLAPVALSAQHAISSYGQDADEKEARGGVATIPAVKILNERGEFSAALGVQPPRWRPHAKRFLPWFRQGNRAVQQLAGLAVMAVKARLEAEGVDGKDRNIGDGEGADLLAKLMQGKDDEGRPMGHEEWVYAPPLT